MRQAGISWASVSLWVFVAAGGLAEPAPGATLAELVGRISETEIEGHIAALEGPRYTAAEQALTLAYIEAELTSYGYAVAHQTAGSSENLIAAIEGDVDPNRVFVVGAHFDTVSGSPGADDDASGVAAVLEIARVLVGRRSDYTIHLVFFALEEVGMAGSETYAQTASTGAVDVIGMVSLDMIAYTCDTPGCQFTIPDIPGCLDFANPIPDVGTFIGAVSNTASADLLADFAMRARRHVPPLEVETGTVAGAGECFPDSRRSDHKSFWDEGFPAMVLGDGGEARNPHYHQASDTLATLDIPFAANVTRAVMVSAAIDAHLDFEPSAVPALDIAMRGVLAAALSAAGILAREKTGPERGRERV